MKTRLPQIAALTVLSLAVAGVVAASGEDETAAEDAAQPAIEIDQAFLDAQENIDLGKEIWDGQCTYCHGRKAYPGKAPKLKPHLYKPDFVYNRTYYGFRGMPPWNEVYTEDEIKAVVAFIMSRQFSP